MTSSLGTLYILPTPIGNCEDITLRALSTFKRVNLIASEDTRQTSLLLKKLKIDCTATLISLHSHNEQNRTPIILEALQQGSLVALVSDAGTPLIHDPGLQLVQACMRSGIRVVPLPGPCALTTALSASGFPAHRFCFEGFLPVKAGARDALLVALKHELRTLIFYEAPHRILETLHAMSHIFGASRQVVLAKELTKKWETLYSQPVGLVIDWLTADATRQRGEMVLLVKGYEPADNSLSQSALLTLQLLLQELPLKKAVSLTASIHSLKKNALYSQALLILNHSVTHDHHPCLDVPGFTKK